jgi:hypothetical protein
MLWCKLVHGPKNDSVSYVVSVQMAAAAIAIVLCNEDDPHERVEMLCQMLCVCKRWRADILTTPITISSGYLPPPSWLKRYGSCVTCFEAEYDDINEVVCLLDIIPNVHTLKNVCITMWSAYLMRHAPQTTVKSLAWLIDNRHRFRHLEVYLLLPEPINDRCIVKFPCLEMIRKCAPTHVDGEFLQS